MAKTASSVGTSIGKGFGLFFLFLISLPLPFLPYLFRGRLRRFKKVHAYTLFFLVMTFLFTYLTLPFDKIKSKYISVAETKLGAEIRGKIEKNWFTGIVAKNLRFTPHVKAGEKPQEMEIDEANVRVAVLPLFLGRVKLNFGARLTGGDIDGSFTLKGKDREIEAKLDKIDLKPLVLLHRAVGRTLTGTVSGAVNLTLTQNETGRLDFGASTGKIDLTIDDVRLPPFPIPTAFGPFTVPELSLGTVRAHIDLEGGAAVFKEVKLSGSKDVEGSVEGYILPQEPLGRSRIRAYLKFKFSDGFFQRNTKFSFLQNDQSLQRAKRPDGFYGYLIDGPLGQPAAMQKTPMATPPPNMTPPKRVPGGPPMIPPMARPGGPAGRTGMDDIKRRLGK